MSKKHDIKLYIKIGESHLSNCIFMMHVYGRFSSHVAKLPDAIRISRVVKCGFAVNRSENFDDVSNCLRYTTPVAADGSNFGAIMCFEQCPRCESMLCYICARTTRSLRGKRVTLYATLTLP